MITEIEVRILENNFEMQLVNHLQKTVWGGDAIPTHQTVTAANNGGLVLGAFINERLVGFSYSFAGYHQGQIYLCSHNLGIHPNFQGIGIGAKLKAEQKRLASKMGYKLISWTYDPLETRNAYLNLSKLGAVCNTYIQNFYGEVDDGLNKGLPTDRFKVEWWIESDYVNSDRETKIISLSSADYVFPSEITKSGLAMLSDFNFDLSNGLFESDMILIPVPTNFQALKKQDGELALDWRLKTRAIFENLFENGFSATQLYKTENGPTNYYVFIKRNTLKIGSIDFNKGRYCYEN